MSVEESSTNPYQSSPLLPTSVDRNHLSWRIIWRLIAIVVFCTFIGGLLGASAGLFLAILFPLLRRSFRTAKYRHCGRCPLGCWTGVVAGNRWRCSGWPCHRRHRRLVHHSQGKKFRLIDRANVDRGFADPSLVQARSCRRNMSVGQSASESP